MAKNNSNGPVAADQLRLLIERIERLEEEKKGIADDIKGVFAEAKGNGFCTKTMKSIIKLRAMDEHQRREAEAMLDLYKAALGMLDGTPLGKWAAERASGDQAEKAEEPQDEPAAGTEGDDAPGEPAAPPPTVEDARQMGKSAAEAGRPVTANPFPARDPRRAAWDEAWCGTAGSDGMDIPAFLRPAPKKKPGAGEAATGGDDNTADAGAGDGSDDSEDEGGDA